MSTSTHEQTIAFFGASGGVCNTTLALALKAGHYCTVLARTPQRVLDMLRVAHNVSLETIDKYLTIHTGHIKDISVVSISLLNPRDTTKLVDTVVFGIGSYPKFQWSLFQPITLQDTTVCADGTATIFRAVEHLASQGINSSVKGEKPLFVSVSTTGISEKARDVPWVLMPLYQWTLHVPHMDKKKAEDLAVKDGGRHVRDCVIVRPTLMTDAGPRGAEGLRVGWEWNGMEIERNGVREPGPQMGWSVGRKDVGGFIFEKVLGEGGWEGKCVSLTY